MAIPLLVLAVRTMHEPLAVVLGLGPDRVAHRDVGSTRHAARRPVLALRLEPPRPIAVLRARAALPAARRAGQGAAARHRCSSTRRRSPRSASCAGAEGGALGLVLGGRGRAAARARTAPRLARRPVEPVRDRAADARGGRCCAGPRPTATAGGRLPVAVGRRIVRGAEPVGAMLAVAIPIAIAVAYLAVDARANKQWAIVRPDHADRGRGRRRVAGSRRSCSSSSAAAATSASSGGSGRPSHSEVTGWSTGARITNAQLALPAPWFTGDEVRSPFTGGVVPAWHVPFALFLLVGALVVAARRRDRQSSRLCVLALGLVAAAWVATSRIVDTPFYYVVQWVWIVGAVVWLAIIWTAVRTFAPSGAARRGVAMVAGAGVLVLAVALVGRRRSMPRFPNPGNDERSLAAIAPDARAAIRALPGPVLIESAGDLRSITMADGIMLLGIHGGVDARFPPDQAYVVGDARTIDPARAPEHGGGRRRGRDRQVPQRSGLPQHRGLRPAHARRARRAARPARGCVHGRARAEAATESSAGSRSIPEPTRACATSTAAVRASRCSCRKTLSRRSGGTA